MSTVSVRDKRILTWKDAVALLTEQVFRDCLAAGWIKPCATKESPTRDRRMYARTDIENAEDRILSGEYPKPKGGAR